MLYSLRLRRDAMCASQSRVVPCASCSFVGFSMICGTGRAAVRGTARGPRRRLRMRMCMVQEAAEKEER